MSNFFQNLLERYSREEMIEEWSLVLDWLFDDGKFLKNDKWNGGYTASFTKKIKRLDHMSDEKRVKHDSAEKLSFTTNKKAKIPFYIAMTKSDSFARDLMRHIRNAIAHSNATIENHKGKLYIEISDYSKGGKNSGKQTAYLYIPLSHIKEFYKKYDEVNKSSMNTTPKDRKATEKYKGKNKTKKSKKKGVNNNGNL